MPTGGGSRQQRLGARWLNCGVAVGYTQTMAVAVLSDRCLDHQPPTVQVIGLQFLEDPAFRAIRATIGEPLEPISAECMNAEIEEAGEADANDRIQLACSIARLRCDGAGATAVRLP